MQKNTSRKKSSIEINFAHLARIFNTFLSIKMTDQYIARVEINTLYFDWHSQNKTVAFWALTRNVKSTNYIHCMTPCVLLIDANFVCAFIYFTRKTTTITTKQLLFWIYRYYVQHRTLTSMNFDNPVYRKTTEDQFSLEKNLPTRVYASSLDDEVSADCVIRCNSICPLIAYFSNRLFFSLSYKYKIVIFIRSIVFNTLFCRFISLSDTRTIEQRATQWLFVNVTRMQEFIHTKKEEAKRNTYMFISLRKVQLPYRCIENMPKNLIIKPQILHIH